MSDIAIRVEGLCKQYRIGATAEPYLTLRDSVSEFGTKILGFFSRNGQKDLEQTLFWALKDVSFEVKQGEVIGIIGRNGAGKTTLLKVLSRITEPTKGRAEILGKVASLLEVGTGFHPELTGRENLYLNGAILGMKKAEIDCKFNEIVGFSGVEKFIDTPIKYYSSGMHVRLAFAVAAHLEPEILLVDEVLAVGDANFQKKCLGKMSDVAKEGRTVLLVSHNMNAIRVLCSRTIWLEGGRIAENGDTLEVCKDYISWGEEFAGETDLTSPSLRPSLSPSHFKWTRLTILNSEGRATPYLNFGEPFEVVLHGVAESPIEDVLFAFGVWGGSGGGYLFDSMQVDSGLPTCYAAGPIAIHIRFDSNLFAPGLFTIDINAHGPLVRDRVPGAARFFVQKSSDMIRETAGAILYPCVWSVTSKVD